MIERPDPCFACGRALGRTPMIADTLDGQLVFVGRECGREIEAGGKNGWQPSRGGPRLYSPGVFHRLACILSMKLDRDRGTRLTCICDRPGLTGGSDV